jgi:hypothetical protein
MSQAKNIYKYNSKFIGMRKIHTDIVSVFSNTRCKKILLMFETRIDPLHEVNLQPHHRCVKEVNRLPTFGHLKNV